MSSIPFDNLPDCAVIRLPIVLAVTGRSRASLWNDVKAGTFPQPLQIGPRSVGWRVGDIRALLASFTTKKGIDGNVTKAVAARMAKRAQLLGA
jgi:predicted DNA-binding transcriptional regulator AlpA